VESAAEHTAPPPGQLLAAERERQGLSRVEIAQRLHMSPSQIEALETGEYSRLPKGPFLRGFVRNYAKALGLDPDAFVESITRERPTEGAPRIVVPSQNIRFDPLGERLSGPYVRAAGLAAVVIALGFAAMYWWLFIRPAPPATHKPVAEAPRTAPSQPPAVEPARSQALAEPAAPAPAPNASSGLAAPAQPATAVTASPPPPAKGATTKSEPAAAKSAPSASKTEPAPAKSEERRPEAAKPDASVAAAPTPAKGEAALQFSFKGESWVEVRDASDKVVFQRLNPGDTEATVTGKLPLRVIVGNAGEVSMRYNGRDFPLEPHTKVAVARFTLE
jgi:cytoskeleton protein RodZ